MHHPAIENGPSRRRLPIQTHRVVLRELDECRGRPAGRHQTVEVPILLINQARIGAAQSHGALDEDRQHGLEVEGRAADDLEDLAGGRLLLQGLGQLAVPSLELLEQADVLDGDHRLVGEGPDQLDLLLGERAPLPPGDGDRADGTLLTEHRHRHRTPEAELPRQLGGRGGTPSASASTMWMTVPSRIARPVDARAVGGAGKAVCRTSSASGDDCGGPSRG